MDIQKFEEAYLNAGGKSSELEKEDGEYTSSKAQMAWEMWQVAKAQTVPEGFFLVPKEPTTHQVDYCQTMKFREGIGRSHKFEDIFVYKAMIEAQEQSHD